jgi:hypothetical protein
MRPSVLAAHLAAGLAAIVSLLAALECSSALSASNQAAQDPYLINIQDRRFSALAGAVPAGASVGYVSDLAPDSVAGQAAFQGARYALAPRLVAPLEAAAPGVSLAVGNFSGPVNLEDLRARQGLTLVHDFGGGILLLRR